MVAALFGCQPHLVQRFLAVDNDFAAVFKGNGQHAAVDFAVDIAVAIPVVQTLLQWSATVDQPGDEIHCRSLLYPVFK